MLFWDATFSAPKSVSVAAVACERKAILAQEAGDEATAAAWTTMQKAVEDAVMVGARASVDYLEDMAGYSRAGRNGIRFVDAHRWTVAQFMQHDSRDRDPQLHVHQAVLGVVECADGEWRRLDGKSLLLWKPAAGAVGDRAMEAHLSQALGFAFCSRDDPGRPHPPYRRVGLCGDLGDCSARRGPHKGLVAVLRSPELKTRARLTT